MAASTTGHSPEDLLLAILIEMRTLTTMYAVATSQTVATVRTAEVAKVGPVTLALSPTGEH